MEWISLILIAALFLFGLKLVTRRQSSLPHRRGLPIIGNFHQLKGKKPHLVFTEWSKELGDIFSVKMMSKQFVVLNSFEAIYGALVTKGHSFTNRPNKSSFRMKLLTSDFRAIVRADYGPKYNKIRKLCQSNIKMYDTGLKRIVALNTEMLADLVADFSASNGKSFNPKEIVYNTVMNIMLTLLAGKTFRKEDEFFKKMLVFEQDITSFASPSGKGVELDAFPWLRFFGNENYKHLLDMLSLRDRLFEVLVREADEEDTSDGEEGVSMLAALKAGLGKEFDADDTTAFLKSVCMLDTVFAGTATTARSTLCFLLIILDHPEIQARIQEEVDSVVGREKPASWFDKDKMPYTQATLLELFRFSSVANLGVPHMCVQDTELCGKIIPAGSTILTNFWALHHGDFWEDSFKFKPERFLDDGGDVVSPSHPSRRRVMPFGAGPRQCMGEVLAKSRLFMIIACIAQKFNLKKGKITAPTDPRNYSPGIVLKPPEFEIIAELR